jgi:hypothetical protein
LRKDEKPGFFVLKEFSAARNRRLSRWAKERLVFQMDKYERNKKLEAKYIFGFTLSYYAPTPTISSISADYITYHHYISIAIIKAHLCKLMPK